MSQDSRSFSKDDIKELVAYIRDELHVSQVKDRDQIWEAAFGTKEQALVRSQAPQRNADWISLVRAAMVAFDKAFSKPISATHVLNRMVGTAPESRNAFIYSEDSFLVARKKSINLVHENQNILAYNNVFVEELSYFSKIYGQWQPKPTAKHDHLVVASNGATAEAPDKGAVCLLVRPAGPSVLLIQSFRLPQERPLWEIPRDYWVAGDVDAKSTCARAVSSDSGIQLDPSEITILRKTFTDTGKLVERVTFSLALSDKPEPSDFEPANRLIMGTKWISLVDFYKAVHAHGNVKMDICIEDSFSITAALLAEPQLRKVYPTQFREVDSWIELIRT